MPTNTTDTLASKVAHDLTKVGSWAKGRKPESSLASATETPQQQINLDQNREPQPPEKGQGTQPPTPVQRWLQQGAENEPFVAKHAQTSPVNQSEASHQQQPCGQGSPTSSTEALKDPDSPNPRAEGI